MSNIIIMNRAYADENALNDVMSYCERKSEAWWGNGVDLSSRESAIHTMQFVKKAYGKEGNKQLEHLVINVTPYKGERTLSTTECDKYYGEMAIFADTISLELYRLGYQNCYYFHIRPKDKVPHLHYVINTTNLIDGKQMPNYTELAFMVLRYLCKHYSELNWEGVFYNAV